MAKVYLGLGSNLGERRANIEAATRGLANLPATSLVKSANVYETEPVGGPEGQGGYLNTAVLVETDLAPREFLRHIHSLERMLGRRRDGTYVRWGPRPIDIDILLWEGVVMAGPELTIPHPRLSERAFALRPLADLDAELVHPHTGKTVRELLADVERRL